MFSAEHFECDFFTNSFREDPSIKNTFKEYYYQMGCKNKIYRNMDMENFLLLYLDKTDFISSFERKNFNYPLHH